MCRTPKVLIAISCNIPIVGFEWIENALKSKTLKEDFSEFQLKVNEIERDKLFKDFKFMLPPLLDY